MLAAALACGKFWPEGHEGEGLRPALRGQIRALETRLTTPEAFRALERDEVTALRALATQAALGARARAAEEPRRLVGPDLEAWGALGDVPRELAGRRFVARAAAALGDAEPALAGRTYAALAPDPVVPHKNAAPVPLADALALCLQGEALALPAQLAGSALERAVAAQPDRSFLRAEHRLTQPLASASVEVASLRDVVRLIDLVLCGSGTAGDAVPPKARTALTRFGRAALPAEGARRGRGAIDEVEAGQRFVLLAAQVLQEAGVGPSEADVVGVSSSSSSSSSSGDASAASASSAEAEAEAEAAPEAAAPAAAAAAAAPAAAAAAAPTTTPNPDQTFRDFFCVEAEMVPAEFQSKVGELNRELLRERGKVAALPAERQAHLWALRQQALSGRCERAAPPADAAADSLERLGWEQWQQLGATPARAAVRQWIVAARGALKGEEPKRRGSLTSWMGMLNAALMSGATNQRTGREEELLEKVQRLWRRDAEDRTSARRQAAASTIQRWWQWQLARVALAVWRLLEAGIAVQLHPQHGSADEIEAQLWGDRATGALFVARDRKSKKVMALPLGSMAPPRAGGLSYWLRRRVHLPAERKRRCVTLINTSGTVDLEMHTDEQAQQVFSAVRLLRDRYSERVVGQFMRVEAARALLDELTGVLGIPLQHHNDAVLSGALRVSVLNNEFRLTVGDVGVFVRDVAMLLHGLGGLELPHMDEATCMAVVATERTLLLELPSREDRDRVWTGLRAMVDLNMRPNALVTHAAELEALESCVVTPALQAEAFVSTREAQLNLHQRAHLGAYVRQAVHGGYVPPAEGERRDDALAKVVDHRWRAIRGMGVAEALGRYTALVGALFHGWHRSAPDLHTHVRAAESAAARRICDAARGYLARHHALSRGVARRRAQAMAARLLQAWWRKVAAAEAKRRYQDSLRANRARVKQCIRSLQRGFPALKLCRNGARHRVTIQLTKDRKRLLMRRPRHVEFFRRRARRAKGVDVPDIAELRRGADSHGFFQHHDSLLSSVFGDLRDADDRMLSIVSSERTFDVVFDTLDDREEFVENVQALLQLARLFVEREGASAQRELWRGHEAHSWASHAELARQAVEFLDAGTEISLWTGERFERSYLWLRDRRLCVHSSRTASTLAAREGVNVGDIVALHLNYVPPNVAASVEDRAARVRWGARGVGSFSAAKLTADHHLDYDVVFTVVSSEKSLVLQAASPELRDNLYVLLHAMLQGHRGGLHHDEVEEERRRRERRKRAGRPTAGAGAGGRSRTRSRAGSESSGELSGTWSGSGSGRLSDGGGTEADGEGEPESKDDDEAAPGRAQQRMSLSGRTRTMSGARRSTIGARRRESRWRRDPTGAKDLENSLAEQAVLAVDEDVDVAEQG